MLPVDDIINFIFIKYIYYGYGIDLCTTAIECLDVARRPCSVYRMHWGLTTALDLQAKAEELGGALAADAEVSVLLLGCGDARHVLRTLAQSYRHPDSRRVVLYVFEDRVELLARQLLQITLALERRPAPEKARLFMELYGNSFLRPSTAKYLAQKSRVLARFLEDVERLPSFFKLDLLKHRVLDAVEDVLAFWKTPGDFDMGAEWDARLRRQLETRFDSRAGIFDWDYYMRLKDADGAERVAATEYKQFRSNGVAFSWLETEAAVSNPTLASSVTREGRRLRHDGYRGDVRSGPFFAFGVATEQSGFDRRVNGHLVAGSTDVTNVNLRQIFHELEYRRPYEHSEDEDDRRRDGVIITEITTVLASSDVDFDASGDPDADGSVADLMDAPRNCSVYLCSDPDVSSLLGKASLRGRCGVAVLGASLRHALVPDLRRVLSDDALVLVEGRKFVVADGKRRDASQELEDSLRAKADACGLKWLRGFDACKDEYALMQVS